MFTTTYNRPRQFKIHVHVVKKKMYFRYRYRKLFIFLRYLLFHARFHASPIISQNDDICEVRVRTIRLRLFKNRKYVGWFFVKNCAPFPGPALTKGNVLLNRLQLFPSLSPGPLFFLSVWRCHEAVCIHEYFRDEQVRNGGDLHPRDLAYP